MDATVEIFLSAGAKFELDAIEVDEKVKNIKSKWLNTFEEQASYVVGAANQTISNSIIKGNLVQKIFVGKSNS